MIIASLNLLIAYLQPHRALHQSDELRTSPDASVPLEASTILPPSFAPTTRELPLLADSEVGGISTLNRTIKLPECDLNSSVDWGEAPRAAKCYGREEDINRLAYNLVEGRYHVLSVQGEGGIDTSV